MNVRRRPSGRQKRHKDKETPASSLHAKQTVEVKYSISQPPSHSRASLSFSFVALFFFPFLAITHLPFHASSLLYQMQTVDVHCYDKAQPWTWSVLKELASFLAEDIFTLYMELLFFNTSGRISKTQRTLVYMNLSQGHTWLHFTLGFTLSLLVKTWKYVWKLVSKPTDLISPILWCLTITWLLYQM